MVDRYLFRAKFDDSDRWVKGELVEVNDNRNSNAKIKMANYQQLFIGNSHLIL